MAENQPEGTEDPMFPIEDPEHIDPFVEKLKAFLENNDVDIKVKLRPKKAKGGNCTVDGDGLKEGMVNIPANFKVKTVANNGNPLEHGEEPVAVVITQPDGKPVDVKITDNGDGTYDVDYTPLVPGIHDIDVKVRDEPVKDAPFKVDVLPEVPDVEKCEVSGPGVQPTDGAVHGVPAPFQIKSNNKLGKQLPNGGFPFVVEVEAPSGTKEKSNDAPKEEVAPQPDESATPCTAVEKVKGPKVEDKGDGTYDCEWTPKEIGKHKIKITLDDKEVQGSPFEVDAAPNPDYPDAKQCVATGPGVEGGCDTAAPAVFTIQSKKLNGENLTVGGFPFSCQVADPEDNQVPVTLKDNGDGTYEGQYKPEKNGKHKVDINCHNPHVPIESNPISGSPYYPEIKPGVKASRCKIAGEGLDEANDCEPAVFQIQAKDCNGDDMGVGGHPFKVSVTDSDGNEIPCELKDNGNGIYDVTYNPEKPGKHRIRCKLDEDDVDGSPCEVDVEEGTDPAGSNVDCYSFVIQAKNRQGVAMTRGGQKFDCRIICPDGSELPPEVEERKNIIVEDKGDGSYKIIYKIEQPGEYTINCYLNKRHVLGSPFKQNTV